MKKIPLSYFGIFFIYKFSLNTISFNGLNIFALLYTIFFYSIYDQMKQQLKIIWNVYFLKNIITFFKIYLLKKNRIE